MQQVRCCKTVKEAERRIREMKRVRETLNSVEEVVNMNLAINALEKEKEDMEKENRRTTAERLMGEQMYNATTGERVDVYGWKGLADRVEKRRESAFKNGVLIVPTVKGDWRDYGECMDIETVMSCVPLTDISQIVATHFGYYSDGGTCQNGTELVMNYGESIYVDLSWWSVMDLLREDA